MPCDKDLLPAILKNIDYPPNVKYIGFVPFTATYEYYLKAKLLINTSEYEGFPNTFIQACLSKTPILSFRVNPDNFIIENNVGLMCEDNIDKAVEFITGLNKEKIFLYGDNAFKYVKENHDIIYSAALYDDIIKRFLKR
jgi:glycosyltransferase involved in cell wall biosynthesis